MADDRRSQRRELFKRALELEPAERSELLVGVARRDPSLAREVEDLLAGSEAGERLVAGVVARELDELRRGEAREPPSLDRVGPYRIVRLLARGGMGAVYLGERDDEAYSKKVAIKLVNPLPPGRLSNEELLQRFALERQILADLDHPNIARLFDGGTTGHGWPYVVMEYVDGESIDAYCDRHRLDVSSRLELFLRVCDAVSFAHRNLVIHRDLKPSNILVNVAGEPKLVDFGIARLLANPAGASATVTALGVLTPEYASPEQFLGRHVTTASDVYSLGAVLYLLLAGRLAHRFRQVGIEHLLRVIRDEDPMRPSAALGRGDEAGSAEAVARRRSTTPARLERTLEVDLDHVVLKALRKEPGERYATVEQLAGDLRRYLAGHPVEARRGTLRYRVRKFVVRHRWRLAAAALLLVVLGVFGVDRSLQSARAAQARARAELLSDLSGLLTEVFDIADPGRAIASLRAPEVLAEADRSLRPRLASSPEIEADFVNLVGATYQRLGDYENAEAHLREALAMRESVHGEDHPAVASTLFRLGEVYRAAGRYDDAEALHRRALEIRRRALGDTHTLVAESMEAMNQLAFKHHRKNFEQAKIWGDEAVALLKDELDEENGPEPPVPASLTSRRFTFGCLHSELAGQADLTVGPRPWQRAFFDRFPRARVARLRGLTQETLQGVDGLVFMSMASTFEETEPLSPEEQDAVTSYVEGGGCAFLVTDDKDFFRANYGLLEPFGIRAEGHWPGIAIAVVNAGARHPVTHGPFGSVQRYVQQYPGAYTFLGPNAEPLAANPLGVAIAAIEPGAIRPGSGPVVAFSDSDVPPRLFLNAVAWCVESRDSSAGATGTPS